MHSRADELDRHALDFVNTNRTQLREDNEAVQKLIERVTLIMQEAIGAHGAWREAAVTQRMDDKIKQTKSLSWIASLAKPQREAARKVLNALAVSYDLESEEFEEVAPHLMNAINASDVLLRLIELRSDPGSIVKVAEHLKEWDEVERKDVLKHYRARRSAIDALRDLVEKGEKAGRSDPRTEKALHGLLKDHPWMVRPEYSNFVSSDRRMTTTLSKIAQQLGVDDFATPHVSTDGADATRPDLVFILGNSPDPYTVTIVELKSPTIPLTFDHLRQLKGYMRQVSEWITVQLQRQVTVHGMLVGQMPDARTSVGAEQELLAEIRENGPSAKWEVVGLQEMLSRTRSVHLQIIRLLEDGEDDAGEQRPRLAVRTPTPLPTEG